MLHRGFVNRQDIDPEYFTRAFNIGVTGCVRCVREIIPELLGDQGGENVGYSVGNMCQG